MDIKNISLHRLGRRKGKKGDTAQLAAQLAPLEEQDTRVATGLIARDPTSGNGLENRDPGSIIVDNDSLKLPKDIVEGRDENTFLRMEPVVLVILGVMLAFIAFVAWQISLTPVE